MSGNRPTESNRLFFAALGVVVLLAATYVFEPALFGARLSPAWVQAETLRNIAGVVGAVLGLLLIFDAFPKRRAQPAPLKAGPSPEPQPEAEPVSAEAEKATEAPSYVEPAPGAVEAAKAPVEAELGERDQAEADAAKKTVILSAEELKVGLGLPHPPPKPYRPPSPTPWVRKTDEKPKP